MNNIELLNISVQLFLVIFLICLSIHVIIMRKIPFIKVNNDYISFWNLLYYVLQFLSSTLIAIILTIFIYYAFETSRINIADTKSEMVYLMLLIIGAFIVSLWINMLTTGVNFIYKLIFYIKLRRNTISNNLRHSIKNKDEQAIIENHKLIKQTDMKVNLSKEETIVLIACLSKHGFNEDVKQMLTPTFYKEQSLMNSFLTSNTEIIEHNVKGLDNSFKPSESFIYKLKSYKKKAIYISYIFIIVFGIQLFFLIFSDMMNISSAIKSMVLIFINLLVIILILLKHSKLKNIYKKEIVYNNLVSNNLKIRKPLVDNILLGLSVSMIIIRCIKLII
ncbi:hypothetical protein B5723_14945 [Mammaliicoccus sciuri]|uniref:hypothetical protein n=1 Tax=Mammaliicoccus sciuri TaxID=1296 RepID=UPI0009FF445D|nr:hypothetical protein [Mammaliicoccus sciuri]ORI00170.1 hypothetical protein B5723_14945 [Mammaliicoccus sciuri]